MTTTLTPHVLAIDDDAAMRQLIGDYLRENELRVTTVATGADMEKVFAEQAIDVVVLDLRLAGEDGTQLAKRLPETSEIPIIIVSGRKDEAHRVMALELGADDYLTKPFGPRELLALVRAVLRRYQTAKEVLPARNEKRRAYRFADTPFVAKAGEGAYSWRPKLQGKIKRGGIWLQGMDPIFSCHND